MLNQSRQLANNNTGHLIFLYFPQLESDKVRMLLLHTFACLENLTFGSFLIYEAVSVHLMDCVESCFRESKMLRHLNSTKLNT